MPGESFVNVTEGSGKKLHTWQRTIGANNVEDEYVLNGEPASASYALSSLNAAVASTATLNSHLLQIMAGSTLKVRIRRVEIHQTGLATTAAFSLFVIGRLTTAGTGGTALTGLQLDTTDSNLSATAMVLPTVKGTQGGGFFQSSGYLAQTAGASSAFAQPIVVWDFDHLRSKPLIIPAGTSNGIFVQNGTAVAGASVSVNVWLDELSY